MLRLTLLAIAVLGAVGWHKQGPAAPLTVPTLRVAYEDDLNRYDGAQTLQRAGAPRRAQPSVTARLNAHIRTWMT